MTIIANIDGPNRDIYLHPDTVGASIHPIDIYKEMRALRVADESLRNYDVFLRAFGNVSKGGGKSTERYVRCESGTRIIPYDVSHVLTITGTIITDAGQEGIACFDKTPLTITTSVDINYVPPQVEIITLVTGSGVTAGDVIEIAEAVWDRPTVEHQILGSAGEALTAPASVVVGQETAAAISDAVWNKLLVDMVTAGSAGERMNAMLTVNKYLALQK
jgi:hypothetical protein